MKNMSLQKIAEACNGIYHGDAEKAACEVSSVVIDSRKVQNDSLFIAIKGARVDGHSFIPQVMENGALCAVSEQDLGDVPYPYIKVASCEQALKDIAEHYRRSLDIKVVGISGSVGKTSTKEMIAAVLGRKYHVLRTPGNFNNEIGLPLTIFMIDREHEAAVLEMGMNHFGEMHRLSRMARPTHCVFTNIGVAHLEYLGSRDGILKAKMEMLDYAAPDAGIFINGDDDKLAVMKDRAVTFGLKKTNQIYADQIENLGLDGIRCRIRTPEGDIHAAIPIPGMHMVYNAMAGTCVGQSLGLNSEEIEAGIRSLSALPGRGHLLHTPRFTLLDDCYNANPVSMRAMLDVLDQALTRKVAVLGDMGELGDQKKELHASVGEHLKDLSIDVVVTIGPLSEFIHEAARTASPSSCCLHFPDKESFLRDRDHILKDGDSVLVKASHYMGFEEIVNVLSES